MNRYVLDADRVRVIRDDDDDDDEGGILLSRTLCELAEEN